ncbi:AGE family epimerase/isomerase [Thermophagus sp. OGC60D27]|uniref:AGE family epimerase/isomerase n=1 Tax=Thermophagus sp. OGC60D27 TaxID=3458415 RepID=UPI004037B1E2
MMVEKEQLLNELNEELKNILHFWQTHTIDHHFGGFAGTVDANGNMVEGTDKSLVLNARILWTFSAAYNFLGDRHYLELAHRAYDYLIHHFLDKKHGGLFWSVDFKGQVVHPRKQIYGQGFGIYAFSEYFKASGQRESLDMAIQLFDLIEKYSFDPQYGGYLEALSREWEPLKDMRLSSKDANSPKSMNTHLHLLEPYSNLFKVWPTIELKNKMTDLVRIFLDKILDHQSCHFNLFFNHDWKVESNIVSFGHDIEGAWLINEAAKLIGNKELMAESRQKTLQMVNAVVREGLASDFSIYYEYIPQDNQWIRERHWWVQAEAMVGLLDAFEHSEIQDYFNLFLKIWQYIQQNVIDHEQGEWHELINDRGLAIPSEIKAGFWKCPYHNTRSLIESIQRLRRIYASDPIAVNLSK